MRAETKRVLIIEDERKLRRNMARALNKMEGVQAIEAGSLENALSAIDQSPFDLILSDLDLPLRSGAEMVGELERRQLRIPLVFISAHINAFREALAATPGIDLISKPISVEALRELVSRKLEESGEDTSPFGMAEIVQVAALGRHTVQIDVTLNAEKLGEVVVSEGEIWSAIDREGLGIGAFLRLAMSKGRVDCRRLNRPPDARNVQGSVESLLLQAATHTDEVGRTDSDTAPSDDSANQEPSAEEAQETFRQALDEGLDALLGRDYPQAFQAFLRAKALNPDDGMVNANLQRLEELGYGSTEGDGEDHE